MAYGYMPYDRVTVVADSAGDVTVTPSTKTISYTTVLGDVAPFTYTFLCPRPKYAVAATIRWDFEVTAMTGAQTLLLACLHNDSSVNGGSENFWSSSGTGNGRFALWCGVNRNGAETQLRGLIRQQYWNGAANAFGQTVGTVNLALSTRYYMTLAWAPGTGTYGTLTLTIRTGSHSGTTIDTITYTLLGAAGGNWTDARATQWKFFQPATSYGTGGFTKTMSFDQKNLEADGISWWSKRSSMAFAR